MELRTLVTGGSGFIGIHVVTSLQQSGRTMMSLGTRERPPAGQEHIYRRIDILHARQLLEVFEEFRPDEVVHLAAHAHYAGRDDFRGYTVNTQGTRNVAAVIAKTTFVKRALFASSVVADTTAEPYEFGYAKSKAVMEAMVSNSGLAASGCAWALLRLGHVWGPWGGAPFRGFFLAVANGRYVQLGNSDSAKRLAYVGNVAYQIKRLLDASAEAIQGHTFYIADEQPVRINDWANLIVAAVGRKPARQVPEPVVRLLAGCGDALAFLGWKNPPLSSKRLANMRTPAPPIPIQDTFDLVGPLPFTTADGVAETVRWLRQEGLLK